MSFASLRVDRQSPYASGIQPFFPVTKQFPPAAARLSQKGTLILRNNRIFLRPYLLGLIPFPFFNQHLIIWPHGYAAIAKGKTIHIIDDIGKPVTQIGHKVKIHGEMTIRERAGAAIGKTLPSKFRGRFWIARQITDKFFD